MRGGLNREATKDARKYKKLCASAGRAEALPQNMKAPDDGYIAGAVNLAPQGLSGTEPGDFIPWRQRAGRIEPPRRGEREG